MNLPLFEAMCSVMHTIVLYIIGQDINIGLYCVNSTLTNAVKGAVKFFVCEKNPVLDVIHSLKTT